MLTLVLGGARSGKSRHAQSLCGDRDVIYIATASVGDDEEMRRRVLRHRDNRPAHWRTIEAPVELAEAITTTPPGAIVLVDCITVWVSNLLWDKRHLDAESLEEAILSATARVMASTASREVVAVSNDVGSGVVPVHPVARRFRDVQGLVNQRLAESASRVVWMVAGVPTTLKSTDPQGSA